MTTININQDKEFINKVSNSIHAIISKDNMMRKGLDKAEINILNSGDCKSSVNSFFHLPLETNPSDNLRINSEREANCFPTNPCRISASLSSVLKEIGVDVI